MTNTLKGPLRQRINQLTHRAGVAHGERLKAVLLAQIEAARKAGADYAGLLVIIAAFESASP